jgi:hypothetical protein
MDITIHHFRDNFKIYSDWIANIADHDQTAWVCWLILVCTGCMDRICCRQQAMGEPLNLTKVISFCHIFASVTRLCTVSSCRALYFYILY